MCLCPYILLQLASPGQQGVYVFSEYWAAAMAAFVQHDKDMTATEKAAKAAAARKKYNNLKMTLFVMLLMLSKFALDWFMAKKGKKAMLQDQKSPKENVTMEVLTL